MPKHKHADAIIAWANGAEIEYRAIPGGGEWCTFPPDAVSWCNLAEYRVKPKTVKKQAEIVIYRSASGAYGSCLSMGHVDGVINAKILKRLQVEWEEEE